MLVNEKEPAMCRRITVTTLLVMAALLLVGVGPASATVSPPGCLNNDFVMNIGKSVNDAHIGDLVTYTVSAGNPNTSGSGCDVDINTASGTAPDGVITNLPGCTGSFPIGTPVAQCGTFTYTIAAANIVNGNVTASATTSGVLHDSVVQDDPLDVSKSVSINVLIPSITVDKTCADAVFGSSIPFQGTVTNNGNTGLTGVTCTDDPVPDQFTPPAGTLAQGDSSAFSGTYVPTANPSTDTVTCSGTDALGLTVSAQATATCNVLCSPAISVAKACTDATAPGQPINFSGSVENTGNVPLSVSCTEDKGTATGFPSSLNPGDTANYTGSYTPTDNPSTDTVTCTGTPPAICNQGPVTDSDSATCSTPCNPSFTVAKTCTDASAPGQPINYTGTVTSTGNEGVSCTVSDSPAGIGPTPSSFDLNAGGAQAASGSYVPTQSPSTDTFSATCVPLDSICGTTPVTHTVDATCNINTIHTLAVTKECTNDGTTVSFSGTVQNTGNEDLNNVSCTDDQGGTVNGVPTTLAVGQTASYSGSYPAPGGTATDTVTCTGTGAISGQAASNNATATCNPPVINEICRTPGFWGTHGCPEEGCEEQGGSCAQNITQAVIDASGGITVCGEPITNTLLNSNESAVEAICVSNKGGAITKLQLARQLAATALNCVVSGGQGPADVCTGVSIDDVFLACNSVCTDSGASKTDIGDCIEALDCFNNGGTFSNGVCTPGGPDNCHNQPLPLEELGLDHCQDNLGNLVQGSSGSSNECNDAIKNACTIFSSSCP
jgi:hypothetical protein